MTRKDLVVAGALAAALLALTAAVWVRPGLVFFNHGDLFAYHWPLRHFTAAALAQGRLPFWNPYVLLGLPHAANPQAALFYPPALLAAVLPVGTALSWDELLHMLWAGLGALLLARGQRLPRAAAAALAAGYALSPFLVWRVTAGIPTLLAALAWAPWAWLAWLHGGALLLGAVWALQFLSGHPQFLLINAAGMALWAAAQPGRLRLWARWSGGAAAALALAAPQWPLMLELLAGSNRSGWPAEFSAAYSLNPATALRWLCAPLFDSPLDAGWSGLVSVYYESSGVWLGFTLLAAAALGVARALGGLAPARQRGSEGALLLVAGGVVLALGTNGPAAALLNSPGASYLRTAARWSLLSLWGLWCLAGSGLRFAGRGPNGVWRRHFLAHGSVGRGPLAAALPVIVLLELAAWDSRFLRPQDPGPLMRPNPAVAAALGGRAQRVLTDPALANPNKTMLYRLRNVNGYEAFYPAPAARWAALAEGEPAADSSRVLVSRWRSDAAARAGVAARLSEAGVETAPGAWPLAAFIDARGRRLRPDPALEITRPERWRLSGPVPSGAAAVALAESRWPGWRAELDGRPAPLLGWDAAFQAVTLPSPPPAALRLSLDFAPTGWPWWALLGAVAWAAWALRAAACLRREIR